MELYKDPENLGWVGCIHFDRAQQSILLVKNLKRQSQVEEEMKKRGFEDASNQRRHKREVMDYLARHGLQKPGKWELLGGKIAFWQGNPDLQKEFNSLADPKNPGIITDAQEMFRDTAGKKVLHDKERLLKAADSTADTECVEESGLIAGQKTLLLRHNDKDRDNFNNPEAFYPRFWYLVESISGGELRTEPVKKTISAPRWIPLLQLHPYFRDPNRYYPFHPAHVPGVIEAAKYFIKRDNDDFFKAVVKYLEETYGKLKTKTQAVEETSWEEIIATTKPLEK